MGRAAGVRERDPVRVSDDEDDCIAVLQNLLAQG